jgi:hypothetical protein
MKIKIYNPNTKNKPKIKCNTFWKHVIYAHVVKLPKGEKTNYIIHKMLSQGKFFQNFEIWVQIF